MKCTVYAVVLACIFVAAFADLTKDEACTCAFCTKGDLEDVFCTTKCGTIISLYDTTASPSLQKGVRSGQLWDGTYFKMGQKNGHITSIVIPVYASVPAAGVTLAVTLWRLIDGDTPAMWVGSFGTQNVAFSGSNTASEYTFTAESPVEVKAGVTYWVLVSRTTPGSGTFHLTVASSLVDSQGHGITSAQTKRRKTGAQTPNADGTGISFASWTEEAGGGANHNGAIVYRLMGTLDKEDFIYSNLGTFGGNSLRSDRRWDYSYFELGNSDAYVSGITFAAFANDAAGVTVSISLFSSATGATKPDNSPGGFVVNFGNIHVEMGTNFKYYTILKGSEVKLSKNKRYWIVVGKTSPSGAEQYHFFAAKQAQTVVDIIGSSYLAPPAPGKRMKTAIQTMDPTGQTISWTSAETQNGEPNGTPLVQIIGRFENLS